MKMHAAQCCRAYSVLKHDYESADYEICRVCRTMGCSIKMIAKNNAWKSRFGVTKLAVKCVRVKYCLLQIGRLKISTE